MTECSCILVPIQYQYLQLHFDSGILKTITQSIFYITGQSVAYVQNSSLAVLNLISHCFVTLDSSIVELNSIQLVKLVPNRLFTSSTLLFKQLLSFSPGEEKYKFCSSLCCIYSQYIYTCNSEHSRECFNESQFIPISSIVLFLSFSSLSLGQGFILQFSVFHMLVQVCHGSVVSMLTNDTNMQQMEYMMMTLQQMLTIALIRHMAQPIPKNKKKQRIKTH